VLDAGNAEQDVVQKPFIGADAFHMDLEDEIGIAGDRVALDDLRAVADGVLELRQGFAVVHLEIDEGEDAHRHPRLLRIEQRRIAADHALALELAHATPAGGG